MRKIFMVVLILALAVVASAQQAEIEQVKSTGVAGFPYTNVGKAFDEYFMKPQWLVFTDNAGNKTVVFKGIFQGNPYAAYLKSNAFRDFPKESMADLVKSLYNVAYDFGLRSDRIYGSDDTKARQILSYLNDRAYKTDSTIEAYFQQLSDGKTWWLKEYNCDTCPTQDVNELWGLILDGRLAGTLEPLKSYTPASAAMPAQTLPARAENMPEKKIASNATKIVQFVSLEGDVAYFDIGRGAQEFSVPARILNKVQALKAGGMATITYDTVERYANGTKITVYTITDIK